MAGGRIPERILEEVLGRVDIVELISGYIPLKRAGRNYKAPCPFHQEKTPSFMVSPERQIYHCFGCGAGGNAFGFLMQYERLGFPEAVEALARKAGVVIPQHQREDEKTASLNLQLYKINEAAAEFYVQVLNSVQGRAAKDYLLKRGIKEETIKGFRLGFAPQGWDALIKYLRAKQFNLGLLERAGLVLPKEKGGYYDRFRNRIIFPICDVKERMIAFGARLLPGEQTSDEQAKYINSPETPVYIKGHNLYGLRFSRDALRQADEAIIVEG